MVRSRVGPFLGSTVIGLLIGAVLVVGIAFASRAAAQVVRVDRSGPSAPIPGTVEWRFSEPQPDWKSALAIPGFEMASLERTEDALRVTLPEGSRVSREILEGGIYVDLPDWRREEWAEVLVSARTTGVNRLHVGVDRLEGIPPVVDATANPRRAVHVQTFQPPVAANTPIVSDGLVHLYRIHLDWANRRTEPWRRIGFLFEASEPASIDILSVRVVQASAARARMAETTLEPPQLKSDFRLFRKALEEAHPALYRHTTKREMDAEFARADAKLTGPMTVLEFRNVLGLVLAAIRDLDTKFTNYPWDEISIVIDSAKQFPLALTFESTRAFVLLNQGLDERVKPGMEVLAVNGQSLAKILQQILPNLAQSGDVRSWPMYQLGMWADDSRSRNFFQVGRSGRTGFSEAYRLYVADPPSFKITLRDPQTRKTIVVDLAGVTVADAATNVERNPVNRHVLAGLRTLRMGARQNQDSIRYLEGEDTAILTSRWLRSDTPKFFKETFAELRSRGTKHLIIDLRENLGGSDQCPPLLFSYLTSKEFRFQDRVYMKTYEPSFKQYTLLREIDPVTDAYYGSAAGIWEPDPNGGWLMTEKYPAFGVQKPSENHFDGSVYVLMNGGSISGGAAFPAIADVNKRATFIGEEAGSPAEGEAGGGDSGPTLPESQLHFRIPMESGFFAIGKSNRRRGTLPKYEVVQTIDDLAGGRDTVLEFTRELIRSGKGR